MRTLCVLCHERVTAEARKRWAEADRVARERMRSASWAADGACREEVLREDSDFRVRPPPRKSRTTRLLVDSDSSDGEGDRAVAEALAAVAALSPVRRGPSSSGNGGGGGGDSEGGADLEGAPTSPRAGGQGGGGGSRSPSSARVAKRRRRHHDAVVPPEGAGSPSCGSEESGGAAAGGAE